MKIWRNNNRNTNQRNEGMEENSQASGGHGENSNKIWKTKSKRKSEKWRLADNIGESGSISAKTGRQKTHGGNNDGVASGKR